MVATSTPFWSIARARSTNSWLGSPSRTPNGRTRAGCPSTGGSIRYRPRRVVSHRRRSPSTRMPVASVAGMPSATPRCSSCLQPVLARRHSSRPDRRCTQSRSAPSRTKLWMVAPSDGGVTPGSGTKARATASQRRIHGPSATQGVPSGPIRTLAKSASSRPGTWPATSSSSTRPSRSRRCRPTPAKASHSEPSGDSRIHSSGPRPFTASTGSLWRQMRVGRSSASRTSTPLRPSHSWPRLSCRPLRTVAGMKPLVGEMVSTKTARPVSRRPPTSAFPVSHTPPPLAGTTTRYAPPLNPWAGPSTAVRRQSGRR